MGCATSQEAEDAEDARSLVAAPPRPSMLEEQEWKFLPKPVKDDVQRMGLEVKGAQVERMDSLQQSRKSFRNLMYSVFVSQDLFYKELERRGYEMFPTALTKTFDPADFGAPEWPTSRQTHRAFKNEELGSLLIISEGLSDPFPLSNPDDYDAFPEDEDNTGFGFEVMAEFIGDAQAFAECTHSTWGFRAEAFLVDVATQQVAKHGAAFLSKLARADGAMLFEIPAFQLPESTPAELRTDAQTVAFVAFQLASEQIPTTVELNTGTVELIAIRFLSRDEFSAVQSSTLPELVKTFAEEGNHGFRTNLQDFARWVREPACPSARESGPSRGRPVQRQCATGGTAEPAALDAVLQAGTARSCRLARAQPKLQRERAPTSSLTLTGRLGERASERELWTRKSKQEVVRSRGRRAWDCIPRLLSGPWLLSRKLWTSRMGACVSASNAPATRNVQDIPRSTIARKLSAEKEVGDAIQAAVSRQGAVRRDSGQKTLKKKKKAGLSATLSKTLPRNRARTKSGGEHTRTRQDSGEKRDKQPPTALANMGSSDRSLFEGANLANAADKLAKHEQELPFRVERGAFLSRP
ncbi:Uncharacterized protein SCF082_LOCUS24582 [Durusdinium trenchii]|uniref:Uncharacterized protein n=1 Tax=Durusdinium trenchii TaxID=1381693 RepID=A0ABP0LWP4_9DINO